MTKRLRTRATNNAAPTTNTVRNKKTIYRNRLLPLFMASVLGCLLQGCGDKSPANAPAPQTQKKASAPQNLPPVSSNNETLSVHVDNIPRADILKEIINATGTKIVVEGNDANPKLTIQVDDVSLRHVLSLLAADAVYTATLTYTNLQDSFPESVRIQMRSQSAEQPAAEASPKPTTPSGSDGSAPQIPNEDGVAAEEEDGYQKGLPAEERVALFKQAAEEDQLDIITTMDASGQDVQFLARVLQESVSADVKEAALGILQDGEREEVIPSIYSALNDADPEVSVRAIEAINFIGTPEDIPALQTLIDSTTNADVKQAAQDSIDLLEP